MLEAGLVLTAVIVLISPYFAYLLTLFLLRPVYAQAKRRIVRVDVSLRIALSFAALLMGVPLFIASAFAHREEDLETYHTMIFIALFPAGFGFAIFVVIVGIAL